MLSERYAKYGCKYGLRLRLENCAETILGFVFKSFVFCSDISVTHAV